MKKTLIKILVSVSLFVFIFTQIDTKEVLENFRKMDVMYIPLIILLLLVNYIISSIRWKKLLIFENTSHVKVRYLINLYFVGAFFNNFMPTSIGGDVYKIYKLGNKIQSKANAFSATFMERFTGIIALVLISYYGLITTLDFWFALLPTEIVNNSIYSGLIKFLLFFGFWIAAVLGFLSLKFLSLRINKVKGLYESLMLYKSEHGVIFWALVTSFLVQFMGIFTQFFIFKALGVDLSLSYAFFVLPVITMASFFIPSLNGVGVQDLLYIQLFETVGVSSELALSASVIYHLFRLLVSLLGGLFYALEKDN